MNRRVGFVGRERARIHLAGKGGRIRLGIPGSAFFLRKMYRLIFCMAGKVTLRCHQNSVYCINAIHYYLLFVIK